MARSVEYTNPQGQDEAYCHSVQSIQLGGVRLATNRELEETVFHARSDLFVFPSRAEHILCEIRPLDSTTEYSVPWSPGVYLAGRSCSFA